MKKALSLFLIIALCLSLCACGDKTTGNGLQETQNPQSNTEGQPNTTYAQASTEYYEKVYGPWTRHSGFWHEGTITFNKDKTCTYGTESLTWEAVVGEKEIVFIYRDGVAVLEGGIQVQEDGTILFGLWDVVSEDAGGMDNPITMYRAVK